MPSDLPVGISTVDPSAVVAEAPYTFETAHPDHIAAMKPGDLVKAIISDVDGGYSAERMWIVVETVNDGIFAGKLDSTPSDMKNLKHGDWLNIPASHVIDVFTGDGRDLPEVETRRSYWERCFVDDCVLQGRCHPDYLYRETPDMEQDGDQYPDSGWRIRGTDHAIAEDEASDRPPQYVALGAVLNADDRWLALIDSEIGSAFVWHADREEYVAVTRTQ